MRPFTKIDFVKLSPGPGPRGCRPTAPVRPALPKIIFGLFLRMTPKGLSQNPYTQAAPRRLCLSSTLGRNLERGCGNKQKNVEVKKNTDNTTVEILVFPFASPFRFGANKIKNIIPYHRSFAWPTELPGGEQI